MVWGVWLGTVLVRGSHNAAAQKSVAFFKGIDILRRAAGRLSCRRFLANQVRLLLHAAAYVLLDTTRRWLAAAGAGRMTLETPRLRLLEIGGRVRHLATHVHLRIASSHPGEPLWRLLVTREGRL